MAITPGVSRVPPEDLDRILNARTADGPSAFVYVEGAWCERQPSVPTDGGAAMLVRFAAECWRRNLQLQLAAVEARRKLDIAVEALQTLATARLSGDLAIAQAAVRAAVELL